ncbi:hypothetical protein MP228_000872 [Amoeboaphelidium protococcarum]|nr:hypothetical protein MP228_000872 [Amoeboaphelidium protococcarum]
MLAKKKLLGEYKIGRTVGEGAFSKVKIATHKQTNQKVAIKIIKKDEEERKQQEAIKAKSLLLSANGKAAVVLNKLSKEVKLLMRLDHPNIIKLHQVIDTEGELYIIMDYASGGELIDYIAAKGNLSEKEGRKFFRQLVSAIDHCHLAGVVHRDLKLENMLLSDSKDLLLSDFGLGRSIDGFNQYLNTFCGTPLYAGPELVSGIKYIGPSADIWSLGIVLYIMIAGKPPFKCDSIAELYAQIKSVKYACPGHFSEDLQKLLQKLLVKDPSKRATMDQLRADPWINKDEAEPPLRVMPLIPVAADVNDAENNDDEIGKLVSNIEELEGFSVYNFNRPGALTIKFSDSDENLKSPSTPDSALTPSRTMEDMIPSLQSPSSGSAVSSVNGVKQNVGRRSSLTSALSRLNPFSQSRNNTQSNRQSGEPGSPQQSSAQRVRSKSVQPGSAFYNTVQNKTDSTQTPSGSAEISSSGRQNQRRHSVSQDVPQNRVDQSQSTGVPLAGDKRQAIDDSAVMKGSQNAQSPIRRSSTEGAGEQVGQQVAVKKPLLAISMIKERSQAPSMELINEEDITGSMPMTTTAAAVSPSRKTISQTKVPGGKPHRVGSGEGSTTLTVSTAHGGNDRRLSIANNDAAYNEDIRSVRYQMNITTVSNIKEPAELLIRLERILTKANEKYEKRGRFTFFVRHQHYSGEVVFEIEVCKIWLLNLHGVRFKRLGGDALVYKALYEHMSVAVKSPQT